MRGGLGHNGQDGQVGDGGDVGAGGDCVVSGVGQESDGHARHEANHGGQGQVAAEWGVAGLLGRGGDLDDAGLAHRRQLGLEFQFVEAGHGGFGLAGDEFEFVAEIVGQALVFALQGGGRLGVFGGGDAAVEFVEGGS